MPGKSLQARGDIVQIRDEGPRLLWNRGRVVELHEGEDGHVRSEKLKTRGGTVSRLASLLYPLEVLTRDPVKGFPELPGADLTPPNHEGRGLENKS